MSATDKLRLAMTLRAAGITDLGTLRAMERVPREFFAPEALRHQAYENRTLPLPHGQTLSAPDVVASMTQALGLRGGERVLEIGTGSGYQAAVLAHLAARVYTVERWELLSQTAVERFASLGLRNIEAAHGDGYDGWPSKAPFDAIIVTCGAPAVPKALLDQLTPAGRLLLPISAAQGQYSLRLFSRSESGFAQRDLGTVEFVPFVKGVG